MSNLFFTSLFAAVLTLSTTAAQSPKSNDAKTASGEITLDPVKSVTASLGRKCIVEVKTTAKKVTWEVPEDLDYVPLTPTSIGIWGVPGSYKVRAMVPNGDEVLSAVISVTITGEVVTPPINKILEALKVAYAAEPESITLENGIIASKADDKIKLAAVYRAAAPAMESAKVAKDVFGIIKGATEQRIDGRLTKVRAVMNADFASFMPKTENAALTDAQKKQAKDTLTAYAQALEEVK